MPFKDDDLFDPNEPGEGMPEELERRPDQRDVRTREVKVIGVFYEEEASQYLVVLRDTRDRRLPIVIGPFEAHAIAIVLGEERPTRPLTHDLLKNVIERMGGKVESLTIDDLWHETYYAKLAVQVPSGTMDIDTRPSDGIALALRADVPIYVSEAVLDEAEKRHGGGESEPD